MRRACVPPSLSSRPCWPPFCARCRRSPASRSARQPRQRPRPSPLRRRRPSRRRSRCAPTAGSPSASTRTTRSRGSGPTRRPRPRGSRRRRRGRGRRRDRFAHAAVLARRPAHQGHVELGHLRPHHQRLRGTRHARHRQRQRHAGLGQDLDDGLQPRQPAGLHGVHHGAGRPLRHAARRHRDLQRAQQRQVLGRPGRPRVLQAGPVRGLQRREGRDGQACRSPVARSRRTWPTSTATSAWTST